MMRPEQQAAYLASQQGPTAQELARALPDLGDATAGMLAELARDPTPDRCDRMLVQLDGARQLVSRLRGLIQASSPAHGS